MIEVCFTLLIVAQIMTAKVLLVLNATKFKWKIELLKELRHF